MYIPYNPNPFKKMTEDCVIRAVSKALDTTWEAAYIDLSIKGILMGDLANNNGVWGAFLKEKGFERLIIPNTCPDCYTVRDFCDEYKDGIYVLGTGTHAVCTAFGNYYDAYDSGDMIPIYAYRKVT